MSKDGMNKRTIALVGNPNCGKTTVFNALTGAKQYVGNWAGVTVEKKEGTFTTHDNEEVNVVDLPGIYSLMPSSEDERVAVEYILSGDADLFVNVVDGTNIERNLYLSSLLAELGKPMAMVVTMMDIVEERGLAIDLGHLSKHIGFPVIGVNANSQGPSALTKWFNELRGTNVHEAPANNIGNVNDMIMFLESSLQAPTLPQFKIEYPNEVESEAETLAAKCSAAARDMHLPERIFALRLLEGDPIACSKIEKDGSVSAEDVSAARHRIENVLKEFPDEVLANSRYGVINGLCRDVVSKARKHEFFSQRVDKVILNRWLGIPCFLLVMYVVFWITQVVGSAFIDFFDILGGTLFVDGTRELLRSVDAPGYVVALLADGLGAGLQTMGTFLPTIFLMFFCLSILEDSGYMARAAFVMDKFMTWLGLPGKSFVPLIVGFGCSVPAIMATRTLESKRDRFLTIFMIPFMSCSAKLPVWVVFAAAFFPENPAKLIFLMYASGIIIGVITGLILKKTLFFGEPSHFIMELPPYHMPRMKHIILHSWDRLKVFIFRAGKVIVPMVLILGVLNTVGKDGSIGNAGTENSLLSCAGKFITPVFEPMGVEKDNWPATVAIFSGLFAKESVIGTLTGLYGQNDAFLSPLATTDSKDSEYSLLKGIGDAMRSVPEGIKGIFTHFTAKSNVSSAASNSSQDIPDDDVSVFSSMHDKFPRGNLQVFSYLLFILLYMPCLAAMGAAFRELGKLYGFVLMTYQTILGWSVATLFYQITVNHSLLWTAFPVILLAAVFWSFRIMGNHHKIRFM